MARLTHRSAEIGFARKCRIAPKMKFSGGSPPTRPAELKKQGYSVTAPNMPDPDPPKLATWLSHPQEVIGQPDNEFLLIGHSAGVVTIMRYLETLECDQVGKVILATVSTDQFGLRELENFFDARLILGKSNQNQKMVL